MVDRERRDRECGENVQSGAANRLEAAENVELGFVVVVVGAVTHTHTHNQRSKSEKGNAGVKDRSDPHTWLVTIRQLKYDPKVIDVTISHQRTVRVNQGGTN